MNPAIPPLIFEPTLAPNPFGEGSPELCWELPGRAFTLSLRLNQFGWAGALRAPGVDPIAHQGDSLAEIAQLFREEDLAGGIGEELAARWILAYESA